MMEHPYQPHVVYVTLDRSRGALDAEYAAQLPAIVVVESGDGHMGNGDNGDSASLYQGITLMVVSNNAQAGDRITVILAGRHGADVAWSTGKDFATSAGINLRTSGSSSVPVSTFSITNEVVTFILAPSDSGSQTAFTMTAYLTLTGRRVPDSCNRRCCAESKEVR